MEGWIKLYRKIIEWEWFKTANMIHLFIYLLCKANHKDNKWQGIIIKRGQLVAGRKSISKETGISQQSIRTCIVRLKSTNEITIKSTNQFSIITINNYDYYNELLSDNNQQPNQQPNQQSTSNQPAINQQLTTNKNIKNDKNNKNEKKNTYFDSEKLNSVFIEFLNMRKKIRKPPTDKAIELLTIRLDKITSNEDTKIKILEQSIMNNWQGLFELKDSGELSQKKLKYVSHESN